MVLDRIDPRPMSEHDGSVVDIAATPPETVISDLLDEEDPLHATKPSFGSVPWPGSTYIISSVDTWQLLTLLDGKVVLAPPNNGGSTHWQCVETKGWLGFRSPISGKYLGHDVGGKLRCSAERHQGWENFCVRARPDGGYVLLMTHFERLWHVGIKKEHGVEKLAKIGDGGTDGIVWEFIKV